jgi:hypothetical protein
MNVTYLLRADVVEGGCRQRCCQTSRDREDGRGSPHCGVTSLVLAMTKPFVTPGSADSFFLLLAAALTRLGNLLSRRFFMLDWCFVCKFLMSPY